MDKAPTTEELGKESYKSHHFEQPICKECQQVNCQCRAVLLKENKPEQPNTELMIIKSIQGLISAVNRELGKLDELTVLTNERKVFIRQVLDDIDIIQRGPLNELQKAFE